MANLNVVPGTNRLKIHGVTTLTISVVKNGTKQECAISGRWDIAIDFGVDGDGRLIANVDWPEDFLDFSKWQENTWMTFGDASPKDIMDVMTTRFKESLAALKPYYETAIKTGLKQDTFVLSGTGYFSMKDPIFTDNADLLVSLTYTGYVILLSIFFMLSNDLKVYQWMENQVKKVSLAFQVLVQRRFLIV